MGRKKVVRGNILKGLRERPVRLRVFFGPKTNTEGCIIEPGPKLQQYLSKHLPRGKAEFVWPVTCILKERVPLVYVFIVDELKKRKESKQDRRLVKILKEWRKEQARVWPSARELTAYIIERAMHGVWEAWGLKPPYTAQEHDNFYRRYVHGHPGAIRTFREALRIPQPWDRHHVGRELRWFLGPPGKAARHYHLLDPKPLYGPVLQLIEE